VAGWWLQGLAAELSQGDVIRGVVVGLPVCPPVHLQKMTVKASQQVWSPGSPNPDHNGVVRLLAEGRQCDVLVVSHGCEIDKRDSKKRILVAPVASADRLSTSRDAVFEQREHALLPLLDIPHLGDCYADLRLIHPVDHSFLRNENRVASMTEEGIVRLQAQLVGFFTRKDLS
jgi:hypothetical protein